METAGRRHSLPGGRPPSCSGSPPALTLGLLVLARGPPADAGAVLVQEVEAHQALGAAAELHHLGPGLHGAHAALHWARPQTDGRAETDGQGAMSTRAARPHPQALKWVQDHPPPAHQGPSSTPRAAVTQGLAPVADPTRDPAQGPEPSEKQRFCSSCPPGGPSEASDRTCPACPPPGPAPAATTASPKAPAQETHRLGARHRRAPSRRPAGSPPPAPLPGMFRKAALLRGVGVAAPVEATARTGPAPDPNLP